MQVRVLRATVTRVRERLSPGVPLSFDFLVLVIIAARGLTDAGSACFSVSSQAPKSARTDFAKLAGSDVCHACFWVFSVFPCFRGAPEYHGIVICYVAFCDDLLPEFVRVSGGGGVLRMPGTPRLLLRVSLDRVAQNEQCGTGEVARAPNSEC